MRFVGKSRLGFYPLPLSGAQRIRSFLFESPDQQKARLGPKPPQDLDEVATETVTLEERWCDDRCWK